MQKLGYEVRINISLNNMAQMNAHKSHVMNKEER